MTGPSIITQLPPGAQPPFLQKTAKDVSEKLPEVLTPNESDSTLCECLLTPKAGANLEAGKAIMRRKIEEAQAQFTHRSNP